MTTRYVGIRWRKRMIRQRVRHPITLCSTRPAIESDWCPEAVASHFFEVTVRLGELTPRGARLSCCPHHLKPPSFVPEILLDHTVGEGV